MTEDKYRILFNNLVNRLLFDEDSRKHTLPGVITEDEYNALVYAQQLINDLSSDISGLQITQTPVKTDEISVEEQNNPSDVVEEIVSSNGIEKLLDTSVLYSDEFLPDTKIGIDFGTAYSKACMVEIKDEEEDILDLPLGIYAGEDSLKMPVHSSLFISQDGRLYLGPIAVEKSEESRRDGFTISRIDSVKSFLIFEERVTIDDTPLQKIYNPTNTEVSKSALIAFFLGYLLFLIRESANDRHEIDIDKVQRRITIPCYEASHRVRVIKELSKLFSMGEVLGKSFKDEWENGFRVQDVMYLYEWMTANIKMNSPYIETFLEEPLAVASSRFGMEGKSKGNVCIVVDVGAGTTDFTMFEIFANAKEGFSNAKEIKNSQYGVPEAGDRLDNILLIHILQHAGISRDNNNYKEIILSLRLDIRDYKERLFKTHKLNYSLPGGITGQILLSDFMQNPQIKEFNDNLKQAFVHVLSNIHTSWLRTKIPQKNDNSALPVILTGGGANLPMIRNLAKGVVSVNGFSIRLFPAPLVPKWIMDEYDGEIIDLYPQMSVSIGSSKQFVIEKSGVVEEYI